MALIQINQFKGINEAVDPTMLGEEATFAKNCDLRDGVLKGTKMPLKKTSIPKLTGIVNIMTYYSDLSYTDIVAIANDGTYILENNIWKKVSTDKPYRCNRYINNFIDDKYILIFMNSSSTLKLLHKDSYGTTTVRTVKRDGKDSVDSWFNHAPYAYDIVLHYDRLWISNWSNVYCSSLTANGGIDIEDFTTPTSPESEVNQHGAQISMYTGDGTSVTGITTLFDDILVFKGKSIFKLSGTGPADLQKIELFKGTGAIAVNTICSTSYGCFFMSTDGIYLYDGAGINKISEKIDDLWQPIEKLLSSYSIATVYHNKYILSVYDYTYHYITIEYDILTGNFTVKDNYNIKSFTEYKEELLFASSDGYIYSYDKGTAENFIWQSGDLTMSEGAIEIEGVKLHTEGTGRLKVSVITEKKTKEKIVDIVKNGVKYISINNTGRGASIKLEQLSGDISVRKLYVEYDLDED